MDVQQGVFAWAAACLVVAGGLLAATPRLGRLEVASWLTVLGAAVLVVEDALLTAWFAIARPTADGRGWPPLDPQGVIGLVDDQVRASMLSAATWGLVGALLTMGIARTALRAGQAWAWRALAAAFLIVLLSDALTALLVFSRGLPLPTPGGNVPGFGWQPVAVGLLAWAAALGVSYPAVFVQRATPARQAVT